MPIVPITFTPGINREVTNYSSKGGFYDCNKVRFRAGTPEKIGGWINAFGASNTFNGVARTLWTWQTSGGYSVIAMGTNQKYYVIVGGIFNDISPVTTGTLTNPFTTLAGSPLIIVNDNTLLTIGSFITYSGVTNPVGGLTITGSYEVISFASAFFNQVMTASITFAAGTATVTLPAGVMTLWPPVSSTVIITGAVNTGTSYNGTWTLATVTPASNQFTFAIGGAPGSATVQGTVTFNVVGYVIAQIAANVPVNSSSSTTAGGTVNVTYELDAGNAVVTSVVGWGAPPWGAGGWGSSTSVSVPLTLWSQVNFGDNLLFALRNGPLYYWTFAAGTYPPAVTINAFAESQIKTSQIVAASVAASTTFVVLNSQGIDYGALVTGVGVSAGTYVNASPAYAGFTTVTVNNPVTLTAGQSVSFSYAGQTAPTQVGQILVSATNQFTVALGSTPYNPVTFIQPFSPMLVRWSDQSLPYEWTPATYNQSGEELLSLGSFIVGGISTRQEILIWTDRALFSMQYVGAPFVFNFILLMDNITLMSPNAMITVNGSTYWMGNDKFYFYNGTVSPLPCSVRKYIFTNINQGQEYQIVCGQNEAFNEIWWHYPSVNSSTNDSYVIFNYLENAWYYGTMNRTAWEWSSLYDFPLAVLSIQQSYLQSAITSSVPANGGSIPILNSSSYPNAGTIVIGTEQITYNGNSGASLQNITRGANATAPASATAYTPVPLNTPNQILYHEYGVDDQSTGVAMVIRSYLQASDFDINGGDHFGYVWRFLPDFTFFGSTANSPQIFLTLNPRNSAGSAYLTGTDIGNVQDSTLTNTTPAPLPPNTFPVEQYTGILYSRIRGRQMNFFIQSNQLGVAWQMGTMRFDVRPDGRR